MNERCRLAPRSKRIHCPSPAADQRVARLPSTVLAAPLPLPSSALAVTDPASTTSLALPWGSTCHFWWLPIEQVPCWMLAPAAVPAPATSRHLPLWTARRLKAPPPALISCHFWFELCLHVHCRTLAPSFWLAPATSRHLPAAERIS